MEVICRWVRVPNKNLNLLILRTLSPNFPAFGKKSTVIMFFIWKNLFICSARLDYLGLKMNFLSFRFFKYKFKGERLIHPYIVFFIYQGISPAFYETITNFVDNFIRLWIYKFRFSLLLMFWNGHLTFFLE